MNTLMADRNGRTADDQKAIRAAIEAANKEAYENWHNPVWRREMAQEVTETILEGFTHENILNIFTEVENAPFDGRVFIKETRGLRAFWMARGGYIEMSELRADVMEMPRDQIGFHVSEFEDKLVTNFAETQRTLIDLGIQRMDSEVNLRMLRLFQAAIPSTSPYYISGSGLSLTALNTALREVRDETNDTNIAIIGRATMTDQIVDEITQNGNYSGFYPETNEQLLRSGVLGTYRGARIVTLRNYKDDQSVPFFPANELYVVARDASKFAFFGGLLSKEFTELDNWYWHYLARRDCGAIVHRPERLRRVVDTSIAP